MERQPVTTTIIITILASVTFIMTTLFVDSPSFKEAGPKGMRLFALAAAALVAGLCMASYAERVDIRLGGVSVDIGTPPPVVRYEIVPPPRVGFVWVPGYWVWDGYGHVWIAGAWVRERPGYVPVPAYWEPRGEHWHYEPPRWTERREQIREDDRLRPEGHAHWLDHRDGGREGRSGDRR